jgi:hypothetical protein
MMTRTIVFAVSCGALAFGCAAEQDETQEIMDNLAQAGFPANDIMVVEGKVYVGRDAHVTLEASREMIEPGEAGPEQYRTTNLVVGKTKICVTPTVEFLLNLQLVTGLNLAIANFNNLPLSFDFALGPTIGCDANITAAVEDGNGGSAGFPSGGNPYGQINIGFDLIFESTDVIEHVITHELGHTIGLRHSDYYNRSISCNEGGNEGSGGVGAILIPGTPSTAVLGGSIMNSCYPSNSNGELTSTDVTALETLY